jgi:hypothetical protein
MGLIIGFMFFCFFIAAMEEIANYLKTVMQEKIRIQDAKPNQDWKNSITKGVKMQEETIKRWSERPKKPDFKPIKLSPAVVVANDKALFDLYQKVKRMQESH